MIFVVVLLSLRYLSLLFVYHKLISILFSEVLNNEMVGRHHDRPGNGLSSDQFLHFESSDEILRRLGSLVPLTVVNNDD